MCQGIEEEEDAFMLTKHEQIKPKRVRPAPIVSIDDTQVVRHLETGVFGINVAQDVTWYRPRTWP